MGKKILCFINPYTGQERPAIFCFTGKSPLTRKDMEAIATKAGGETTKSVCNLTTILVIADPSSTSIKAQKARSSGVHLISPAEFFEMCENSDTKTVLKGTHPKKNNSKKKTKPTNKENRYSTKRRIQL